MNYNKPVKCVCHNCGKKYMFYPNNPEGNGLRRCSDCMKLKRNEIKWVCTCGRSFDSRAEYYNHRRDMRNAGTPCNKRVTDSECPFCGKPIGSSHNIYAVTECWMNHRCPGVDAIEAAGGSLRFTMEAMERLKGRSNIRNTTRNVDTDKLMELMWVKSLVDRTSLINDFILTDTRYFINQLVLSFTNKVLFIFDGNITNKLKVMFTEMHWTIIELKWTDCIKNREEIEKQVINKLQTKEV